MPPQSRRQKKYEAELRHVQLRNRFAAGIALLAIAATAWFVWYVFLRSKPTIFVSINRVSYNGARKFPVPEGQEQFGCDQLASAFSQTILVNDKKGVAVHEIDSQDSDVEIPPDVGSKDTLLVYFQGHLVDGASRPSQTVSGAEANSSSVDSDDVFWICPEAGNVERSIDDMLRLVNESKAMLKVVIFDAGQYSWSPVFPGRPANEFQSALDRKLKQNELNLDSNLWVIVSHSDREISNCSTPLKSSLFSFAVAESIRSINESQSDDFNVPRWFENIRRRTVSFSQDFSGRSIQHPVLMRAGKGVLSSEELDAENLVVDGESRLVFTPQLGKESEPETKEPNLEFDWLDFSVGSDRATETLLARPNVSAIPFENIRALEDYLERGATDFVDSWNNEGDATGDLRRSYLDQASAYIKPDFESYFDPEKLQAKRDEIAGLRRNIFEYSVWNRFRNQMRFFDNQTNKQVDNKQIPNSLKSALSISDDTLLKSSSTALDDRQRRIDSWSMLPMKSDNKELLDKVINKRKDDAPLSPLQAEMLGKLSQRYLPLLQATLTAEGDAEAPATSEPSADKMQSSFQLDLTAKDIARYDRDDFKTLVDRGKQESLGLTEVVANESDTAFRFYLAAVGSDLVDAQPAKVPNIEWAPLTPEIKITSGAPGDQFKVPTFSTRRVVLGLETLGIESVDLKIVQKDSGEDRKLESFKFGLDDRFSKTLSRRNLREGEKANERVDSIELYFRYETPEEWAVGKEFQFELEAQSWSPRTDAVATTKKYPFSIRIAKDVEPVLSIERQLGNLQNDRSQVKLFQWGRSIDASQWQPLQIRTLPNLKSKFKFQLRNNSESDQAFEVKLYRLRKLPPNAGALKGDRVDSSAADSYLDWLVKRVETVGAPTFNDNEFFELIATSEVDVPANRALHSIEFTTPIAPEPPPGETPSDPPAKNPAVPSVVEMEHPLLLVLYTKDSLRSERELRKPDWFQMIVAQPQEPWDPTLEIYSNLKEVFGDQLKQIPEALVDDLKTRDEAAKMTTVNRASYLQNRHWTHSLKFESLLGGSDQFVRNGEDEALLLVDLLGVPNSLSFTSRGSAMVASNLELTGVKVKNLPPGWMCYPESWSFVAKRIDDPQFKWLAGDADQSQSIFIRPKPGDDLGMGFDVEMLLPSGGADILSSEVNDFQSVWRRGPIPHRFVNLRTHRLVIGPDGVTAWTEVTTHTRRIDNCSNLELEIGKEGNTTAPLGRWKFVTESLEMDPRIENVPPKVELSEGAFANTKIELDFSRIQPPVKYDDITLYWDGGKIDKKQSVRLLEKSLQESGLFEVTLADLVSAYGGKIAEIKDGAELSIKIEASDFFEYVTEDRVTFNVAKPKQKPPEAKPLSSSLSISLLDAAGQPANIGQFGTRENPNRAVVINGVELPLFRTRAVGKMNVKVTPSGSTLTINGLQPGKFQIEVYGIITPTGQAKKERSRGSVTSTLVEGKNEAAITLKYWDGN